MSERLLAAVRAGDEAMVRAIVEPNPDLASRNGALHAAVLAREPTLVRILMAHGANARVGVYRTAMRRALSRSPWNVVTTMWWP